MNSLMHTTLVVNTPPTRGQLRRMGWNAYCDGISLDSLATEDEKRGWMAANRAETVATMPVECAETHVAPHTVTVAAELEMLFTASTDRQSSIDFEAELADLIEGREDEAFWRSGAW